MQVPGSVWRRYFSSHDSDSTPETTHRNSVYIYSVSKYFSFPFFCFLVIFPLIFQTLGDGLWGGYVPDVHRAPGGHAERTHQHRRWASHWEALPLLPHMVLRRFTPWKRSEELQRAPQDSDVCVSLLWSPAVHLKPESRFDWIEKLYRRLSVCLKGVEVSRRRNFDYLCPSI